MKANDTTKECPKCHQFYKGYPAISRVDNKTAICPRCGSIEALENLGLPSDEIKRILDKIPNEN